jgi:hypothetical protein
MYIYIYYSTKLGILGELICLCAMKQMIDRGPKEVLPIWVGLDEEGVATRSCMIECVERRREC